MVVAVGTARPRTASPIRSASRTRPQPECLAPTGSRSDSSARRRRRVGRAPRHWCPAGSSGLQGTARAPATGRSCRRWLSPERNAVVPAVSSARSGSPSRSSLRTLPSPSDPSSSGTGSVSYFSSTFGPAVSEGSQLLYWLNGAMDAVDAGVIEADQVFLPWLVGGDGKTISEAILRRLCELGGGSAVRLLGSGAA